MTCSEFRETINDQSAAEFHEMTKGLRAALIGHYLSCEVCQAWNDAESEKELASMTPVEIADFYAYNHQLSLSDREDPEFVETVRRAVQGGDK